MKIAMKEKIIAVIFCLVICGISVSTLFRMVMVEPAKQEGAAEAGARAEKNTIAEYHEKEKELMKQSQEGKEAAAKEEKQENFLDTVDKAVNRFTDGLSGKAEGAKINSEISSAVSGNTYIESKTVLLGKDNWLFYKAADDGDSISDYKGTNHYTKEKMKSIMKKLEREKAVLKSKGAQMILLMLPNKESVYAEYMPDNVKRKSEKTRMDIFADYLQKYSKLKVVYPKQELVAAKAAYQTYYKTDTHWNQIGVFIGVQALKEKIDGSFDSLAKVEFEIEKKNYAGDLAKLCKMTDTYQDDIKYALKPSSVKKGIKSGKKLLIIGDSFSDLMPEIAKKYFAEVRTIGVWSFSLRDVEKYKPDIVVWECVERYLDRYDWIKLDK